MYPAADPQRALPPLYARWIEAILNEPLHAEPAATCLDCAMQAGKPQPPSAYDVHFNAHLKCCTHLPALPNFTVGLILQDPDPALRAGRAGLEQRLASANGLTPLGIDRPQDAPLDRMHDPNAFGRDPDLLCPHYDNGLCGIWKYRNSTCSTWFCKFQHGLTGLRFWRTVQALLYRIERHLSVWCLRQLGLPDRTLELLGQLERAVTQEEAAQKLSYVALHRDTHPQRYAELWAQWTGHEREFFAHCAELILPLTWQDVRRIGGIELVVRSTRVKDAHKRITQGHIPARTQRQPNVQMIDTAPLPGEQTRVWSFSPYDPLELPDAVLNVLHYFDGRPTQEAVQIIQQQTGVQIDDATLQQLVDWHLIEPVE